MKEKNNLHLIDSLFETNEGKSITIKIVGKEKMYYLKKEVLRI